MSFLVIDGEHINLNDVATLEQYTKKNMLVDHYTVAILLRGRSSIGKCIKVAKNESAIDKYQA